MEIDIIFGGRNRKDVKLLPAILVMPDTVFKAVRDMQEFEGVGRQVVFPK
jgi:methyl coenzyme M reductase subunit D